jgi:hypothetical protein
MRGGNFMRLNLSADEAELTEKFRALSAVSKNAVLSSVRFAVMEGAEREEAVKRQYGLTEPPRDKRTA